MNNKSYFRSKLILIFFVLLSLIVTYVYADESQERKTVSGTIEDSDWVKSIITVRCNDPLSGNDEIDIIVPDAAKIMNGAEEEPLSDLEQGDQVTVTYYDDGVSGLKATHIQDLNAGNEGL